MHLAEEQVQRFLHGELSPLAASSVRGHLKTCAECRARVGEAGEEERWVLDRFQVLDHVQPPLQSTLVVAAAKARSSHGWGRWAAGIILAMAVAGGAYAAPGSPLPGILERVIHAVTGAGESARPIEQSETVPDVPAGVAIRPGKRLTIAFSAVQPGDTVVISLSDVQDVVVQARGGHTGFTSDPDRLVIEHQGASGRFDIVIPRAAPWIEIVAGGRRLLLKEASRLTSDAVRDAQGRYVIPLVSGP